MIEGAQPGAETEIVLMAVVVSHPSSFPEAPKSRAQNAAVGVDL